MSLSLRVVIGLLPLTTACTEASPGTSTPTVYEPDTGVTESPAESHAPVDRSDTDTAAGTKYDYAGDPAGIWKFVLSLTTKNHVNCSTPWGPPHEEFRLDPSASPALSWKGRCDYPPSMGGESISLTGEIVQDDPDSGGGGPTTLCITYEATSNAYGSLDEPATFEVTLSEDGTLSEGECRRPGNCAADDEIGYDCWFGAWWDRPLHAK